MLAVPSAAASAMNQTTGVCRTTTRASEMTSVCIPTTVGRRTSAVLAEIGHDGGADAKRGHIPSDVTPSRSNSLALSPSARRWRWQQRRCTRRRRWDRCARRWRRVGLELNEAWGNVRPWRRGGTGQRFTELFLRHLAQQSALEHPGAVHVDVAAQPLPTADVRVLVTGSDVELLALSWCRRHQALLHPVGVVERVEVRDYARIHTRCRRHRILAQHGGLI